MEANKKNWGKKKWFKLILRVSLPLTIAFFLCQFDLDYLEAVFYDLRVQTKMATPISGQVKTIAIDRDTVKWLDRDPNVTDHITLLKRLKEAEPKAIVYIFNPINIDGSFEEFNQFALNAGKLNDFYIAADQLPLKGQETKLRLDPPLESIKVIPGPKTVDQNILAKDEVTRRLIFSFQNQLTLHPMLASELNGFESEDRYQGVFEYLGAKHIYIDFRPKGTYKPTSFKDILTGEFNRADFKDKVIFIGMDLKMQAFNYIRTPYSRDIVALSTLEMHANMLDTLILNTAPIKAPKGLDIFFTALISIFTVFVVLTMRPTRGLLMLVGVLGIFTVISYIAFAFFRVWFGMAHPVLAIFICYYFFIPYRLIMENRRSWEYFQKNKLLTQVEELKSNFLRMMSHDLKTPLARIQGMTDIVVTDNNELSHRQLEAIQRISRSTEELNEFVGSILSLGRIESKEIKLQLKSKDINHLLENLVEKLDDLAKRKDIEIITEFEPLFSVKVDEDLLKQVFTNLLENAIKYSPENSKILVSTEEVEGKLIVQVADQGVGIPLNEQENVFTKFYRSKDAKNSPIKGSGLGLYLAKYFVELHKGRIFVESEPKQGSTFTVELPMDV